MKGFEYKCKCDWSKNGRQGYIPNRTCPIHGKYARKMLNIKMDVVE